MAARRQTRRLTASVSVLAATLAAAVGVAACGGGKSDGAAPAKLSRTRFVPADFVAPGRAPNRWLPLEPGTQWVRQGATDVGHRRVPHRVVSTVTDVSRRVNGVRTIVLLDQEYDAGQLAQNSVDFLAEDRRGNVWYLGSYTEAYEGGRFVSVRDAWLAGIKGALPGILMPADPRAGAGFWFIAKPPGDERDVAQVVASGRTRCVPFRCYKDVLVVREGKASAPDNEFKYYAPGVGQIDNQPRSASQHRDVERLLNLRRLSPRGLAEASAEVLKLDRHARVTKPAVFGRAPAAKRTG